MVIYSMHKYTAKLSLLLLIILEASIYDEGVLSEGFCPEGAYVLMELCMEGVLSEGVLSGGGFVLPSRNHTNLRNSSDY